MRPIDRPQSAPWESLVADQICIGRALYLIVSPLHPTTSSHDLVQIVRILITHLLLGHDESSCVWLTQKYGQCILIKITRGSARKLEGDDRMVSTRIGMYLS